MITGGGPPIAAIERNDRRQNLHGRRTATANGADVFDEATEQTAVRTVDRILARAAAAGASDIHLERTPDNLRVRFRVDGTFRDIGLRLERRGAGDLRAAEGARRHGHRRAPAAAGRPPQRDDRIAPSRLPRLHVSDDSRRKARAARARPEPLKLELSALGMRSPLLDDFREIIHKPEGLILITGPTGSGKTSTLYAALGELVETGKNITTIENPVEYELPGTNQGQINEKAGFTFAKGLRAVLRQDPDVIMVGEIRDLETLHGGRGVAHRTSRVLDAPYQQRDRHHHAAARHGHRAVLPRVGHSRACSRSVLVRRICTLPDTAGHAGRRPASLRRRRARRRSGGARAAPTAAAPASRAASPSTRWCG